MIKHNGSGVYHILHIFSFSLLLDKYHATKSETLFLSISLVFFFISLFYYLPLSVIKFFLISLVGLDFMRLMITKTKSINTHIYIPQHLDSFGYLIRISIRLVSMEWIRFICHIQATHFVQIHHSNARDKHTSSQLNDDDDTKLSTFE